MTEFENELRDQAQSAVDAATRRLNVEDDKPAPSNEAQAAGPADQDPIAQPSKGA